MSAPSSLTESPLHAEVESPCHAFTSNGIDNVEFWRVSALAMSTTPAFSKYSCTQASGDPLTDVLNFFNYVTSHTWDFKYNSGASEYEQTDTLDPDTFEALTATAVIDTDDFNGGLAPTWNNFFGYEVDPNLVSTAGPDWDKSSTRAAITAALDGVNWSALWAGSAVENSRFDYDRVSLTAMQGRLPFGGTASGNLNGIPGGFGPNKVMTGTVGWLDALNEGARSTSDEQPGIIGGDSGILISRTQLQIRNYPGTPIPYFLFERAEAKSGVTILGTSTLNGEGQIQITNSNSVYRKLSEGTWDHDLQIIQLPDAAMDGPQTISTSGFGSRVRNGTYISMVVGMTFEDFLAGLLGPTWADHLWT